MTSKYNEAWQKILDYKRGQGGASESFEITSDEIKKIGGEEPRLMAKHDHKRSRPACFQKENLSILSVARGRYLVGNFDAYEDFPSFDPTDYINYVSIPDNLDTFAAEPVNENQAIRAAYNSGILNQFFRIPKGELLISSAGRCSSGEFSFSIKNHAEKITVRDAQIEIDECFESDDSIFIIEAKCITATDFIVRQLYYPYRYQMELNKKHGKSKKVRPVYLVYSNGVFSLYEYEFLDEYSYSSINLVRKRKFAFIDSLVSPISLFLDFSYIHVKPEPLITNKTKKTLIPFPQADNFERIIDLCHELSMKRTMTVEDIIELYGFTARQAFYYIYAAEYLTLTVRIDKNIFLSSNGRKLINMRLSDSNYYLMQLILSRKVFNVVAAYTIFPFLKNKIEREEDPFAKRNMKILFDRNKLLLNISDEEISQIIRSVRNELSSYNTLKRRSQTVRRWCEWIVEQLR